MKIIYKYKDEVFDDIRDVVHNNKLDIDFEYIFEEYLPFQAFVSGRTFFKGLTIEPSVKFDPFKYVGFTNFDRDKFSKGVSAYLNKYGFDSSKKFTGAVSGGVDSSAVALEMRPDVIYSGYYSAEDFFDETPYSKAVAETIGAEHRTYELSEADFLENVDVCMDIICTPIAGLGTVMEYTTLKKAILDMPGTDQVFFGNGGDEIFMGYFFNYYVKEFYEKSYERPEYMPNFLPSKKAIAEKMVDMMIVASLNRGPLSVLYSPFVINEFIPMLDKINSVVDKLLFVNINITLPTLLHLNNQFCRANNVRGFNPLANEKFIEISKHINSPMSELPKQALRDVCENMPDMIRNNNLKRGFPIPTEKWHNLNDIMRNAYDEFFSRPEVVIGKKPYDGINRYTWGIFQSELCLRRFR
jgi:asparagine synthetase B (glutamine-hydrolysing)